MRKYSTTRRRRPAAAGHRAVVLTLVAVTALLLSALAIGPGCSSSDTDSSVTSTTAGSAGDGGRGAEVTMVGLSFMPETATVSAGETVTWTNDDSVQHNVVADDGAFESGLMDPGDTFTFTFAGPGTFAYHCSIHPSMTGMVVVQ